MHEAGRYRLGWEYTVSCERTLVNVLSCMESLNARKREAHVAHGQELSTCGFVKVLPDPDYP